MASPRAFLSALAAHAKHTAANKFHASRTPDGYASQKEARRARQLHHLQQSGLISGLREQVSFELIPVQRDATGAVIERACSYIADFVYVDKDGNRVVEDTKGVRTPQYIIKRKLMLHVHGLRIREI